MNLRRIFAALPVALILALAGYAVGPNAEPHAVVQMAGMILPSATPTATNTVTPTATSTPTSTPTNTATPTPTFTPTPTRTPPPTATRDPNLRWLRVPILMYHYVSVPPPDADKDRKSVV